MKHSVSVVLTAIFILSCYSGKSYHSTKNPYHDYDYPQNVLIEIHESKITSTQIITSNRNFESIYTLTIDVKNGDILRLRGQVEFTNDNTQKPVRGIIRLTANNSPVGVLASQNCAYEPPDNDSHHMPLWMDGVYIVSSDLDDIILSVDFKAYRWDEDIPVKIEDGYGHLVVEQYRSYNNLEEECHSCYYGLTAWGLDNSENSRTYGSRRFQKSTIYETDVNCADGDIIRLLGQSTSQYGNQPVEMHGSGIHLNQTTRISPWATENTPWAIQTVPLYSDAIYKCTRNTTERFSLTMHGVMNNEEPVYDAGHLIYMQFSKIRNSVSPKFLKQSIEIKDNPIDQNLTANLGWFTINTYEDSFMEGDVLRITGFTQIEKNNSFRFGINCISEIVIIDPDGNEMRSSPTIKYMTPRLEHLPLRTEQLFEVQRGGDHKIVHRVRSIRSNANPILTLLGNRSNLIIDHYSR